MYTGVPCVCCMAVSAPPPFHIDHVLLYKDLTAYTVYYYPSQRRPGCPSPKLPQSPVQSQVSSTHIFHLLLLQRNWKVKSKGVTGEEASSAAFCNSLSARLKKKNLLSWWLKLMWFVCQLYSRILKLKTPRVHTYSVSSSKENVKGFFFLETPVFHRWFWEIFCRHKKLIKVMNEKVSCPKLNKQWNQMNWSCESVWHCNNLKGKASI